MKEVVLPGAVAYAVTQYKEYNTTDQASKLQHLHELGQEYVEKGHPQFYDTQFLEHHIEKLREEQRASNFSFDWLPENPHGNFLKLNTHREGHVLPKPATVDDIEKLLHQEPEIRTLVLTVYSNGYSIFREIAQHLHKEHPEIAIVAGAVGSEYEETGKLAHYVLSGNQINDMRRLLGEQVNDPLRIATARSHTSTTFNGITKESDYGVMISSYGCPYKCNFCPVTAQYKGGQYDKPHTPDEIVEAIYQAHANIAPGQEVMSLSIADPQGLGDVLVWKEVLKRCKNMGFMVELATTTSSKILNQYKPEELTGGDLCLTCVNIGVESMLRPYVKNRGVDLRSEIQKYQSAGIRVAVTFIIGHDWHNQNNIWEDVNMIQDLGASGYIVSNMMMERGTLLFEKMKAEGRLFDVPPEFEASYGYQAFKHPYFNPGFNTVVPILSEIEARLNQGTEMFIKDKDFYMKRSNPRIAFLQRSLEQKCLEIDRNVANQMCLSTEAEKQKARLYYEMIFRNIDLFHPYINWNV